MNKAKEHEGRKERRDFGSLGRMESPPAMNPYPLWHWELILAKVLSVGQIDRFENISIW